jgi:glycosyltransferase involved in cell wall biosynthesis
MKILFLADIVPYPPNTGIKIRTYNIIKELSNNGNDIYLLAFNHSVFINDASTKKQYQMKLEELCREVHIFEIPSEKNLFSRYFLYLKNFFQDEPYRVQRYYSGECVNKIGDILSRAHIDLCHMDKTEFYKYEGVLGELPVFATNHNIESDLMRQRIDIERSLPRKLFAYKQWKKTEKYERYALNEVTGYVTCTENDVIYFKNKYGTDKPYVVVENGVDCDYYQPLNEKVKEDYFLIIGAQNKESTANYDATLYFLDEIWPIVKKSIGASIKIVGRNPDGSILDYEKKDNRVEVIGYVDDERDIFRKARALIVPLRIGGGSRLKILTAFGLGKAVISTSKGAEGIHYIDGESILIGDSPELFADHMVRLWFDKRKANLIGESARRLALDRYDWKILGQKLDSFYKYHLLQTLRKDHDTKDNNITK